MGQQPVKRTGIVAAFGDAIGDIDTAFKVSNLLKSHFVLSFENAAKNPGLTNSQKNKIEQAKRALLNIKGASIEQAEKEVLATLYHFGIISVASVAEQLMKSVFSSLLENNLQVIGRPEKFTISLADLKETSFEVHQRFWVKQILDDLYGAKGAQEKLNFQNVKAVQSLLNDYFGVNLADVEAYEATSKRVHFYYQIRHILTHNGGYVDKRFRQNLEAAKISTKNYPLGSKIVLSRVDYDECRDSFTTYFAMIEAQIKNRGLKLYLD